MQKGDGSTEFRLRFLRATDAKVNRTQTVARVFLGLALRFARADPKDYSHQGGTEIDDGPTRSAPH